MERSMSRMMAVLHAVIEEYVETGSPVGSRTLAERGDFAVSPATIRSDLSRLEGSGHLTHPHVSAGRIPTDLGYRAAVDDDLASGAVVHGSGLPLVRADSVGEAMRGIAAALANMTHCLAIVSDPVSQSASISRIALVRTKGPQAVLIVVCDDGRVESRKVSCPGISDADLARVEGILATLFVGSDVSRADLESYRLDNAVDGLVARLAQLVRSSVARAGDAPRTSAGVRFLLAQPEFREATDVRPFVGAFEDDDIDFGSLLTSPDGGLVVRIGRENPDDRLSALSFVAREYQAGSGVGFVACVGPTRMDYRVTIGAVEAGAEQAASVIDGTL